VEDNISKTTRITTDRLIFFFILCIVAASLPHPEAINSAAAIQRQCPAFADIIPDVISTCPQETLTVVYSSSGNGGAAVVTISGTMNGNDVASAPAVVFAPQASSTYYYTTLLIAPDEPSVQFPTNRNTLLGVNANARLSSTVSLNDYLHPELSGSWIFPYTGPKPAAGTGSHRYAFLTYRHKTEATGITGTIASPIRFDLTKWLNQAFNNQPELYAATWFYVSP